LEPRWHTEANNVGTGSSGSGQSDCRTASRTQVQDALAAVDASHKAVDQAAKLAIAAAQAFLGEELKLKTYSAKMTEILDGA